MEEVFILRIPALEWLVKAGIIAIAVFAALALAAAIKETIDQHKAE